MDVEEPVQEGGLDGDDWDSCSDGDEELLGGLFTHTHVYLPITQTDCSAQDVHQLATAVAVMLRTPGTDRCKRRLLLKLHFTHIAHGTPVSFERLDAAGIRNRVQDSMAAQPTYVGLCTPSFRRHTRLKTLAVKADFDFDLGSDNWSEQEGVAFCEFLYTINMVHVFH